MNINFKNDYLFRGKRKDNGEWVTGQLYIEQNSIELNSSGYVRLFSDYYIEADNIRYLIISETLGQYTNVYARSKQDNKFHKIFDNDLCYVSEFNREGKDTQHLCRVTFGCKNDAYFTDVNSDWCIAFKDVNDIEFDVEFVGNIYDNPELLEENADNKCREQFDMKYDICIYKEVNKTNND